MIRDVGDVQNFIDRHTGGVGRRPFSLLRILAWMVVGLYAIGSIWQVPAPDLQADKYNQKIDNNLTQSVTLDKQDPRGFATTAERKNQFTIAWVGPSTLQSISKTRYSFVPADVRERIPEIDGRQVVVDMYFMSGARSMDLYAAVRQAVRSDADMVIVDLNPLWLFNDNAVQSWDNLDPITFAAIVKHPSEWWLGAQLFSPSDAVLGVAQAKLSSIRDRWSYSNEINDFISHLNFLDASNTPSAEEPSELQKVASMSGPIEFWSKYRPGKLANASIRERQIAFVRQSNPDGETFSQSVVDHMLGSLAEADVPVLAYVPPLDPQALGDKSFDQSLASIERRLGLLAAEHATPLMTVENESLGRVLPPMKFNDLVHLAEDGPLVTYLADKICAQLIDTGRATVCRPSPEEKP